MGHGAFWHFPIKINCQKEIIFFINNIKGVRERTLKGRGYFPPPLFLHIFEGGGKGHFNHPHCALSILSPSQKCPFSFLILVACPIIKFPLTLVFLSLFLHRSYSILYLNIYFTHNEEDSTEQECD